MFIGKLEAYAMKRVAAGAHRPSLGYLSLQNTQTIEPTTTVWTAAQAPGTGFHS